MFLTNYTIEARYMGTRGVHLLTQNQLNRISRVTLNRSLPTYMNAPSQAELDALTLTLPQIQARSSYEPRYAAGGFTGSNITAFMPWGNSNYHGLALQLNRRFARGFQVVGAYTWSHNIDDSTATHFSTYLTPRRPQSFEDMRVERASSALDRRQRFTLNAIWETPWLKNSNSWVAKNLVGNWRIVGTYTAETGEPVTPQSGIDSNLNGDAVDRTVINQFGDANRGSDAIALRNSAGAIVAYQALDPTARYIKAGLGVYPNAGRNTLLMPGINNFDFSIGKRFNFTERTAIEFRSDFANAFNHPQYTAGYVNSVRLTSQTTNRTFLIPSNPQFASWSENFPSNARSIQFALRFIF